MERIARQAGLSVEEALKALGGAVYLDPRSVASAPRYLTSDEYLSGNIFEKLGEAKEAAEREPLLFTRNVKALEAILPPEIPGSEVYIALGAPWLPEETVDDFIYYLFGDFYDYFGSKFRPGKLATRSESGVWKISQKTLFNSGDKEVINFQKYGTSRVSAIRIIEATLNCSTIRVYDTVEGKDGKRKRAFNEKATHLAWEKQELIEKAFRDWVHGDKARLKRLMGIYYEKYGAIRKRTYHGDFLSLPGLSGGIALRDYQKDAVARILLSPSTLLAHDVGAGKTYVMAAAAMELRRMGLAKKVMIVVPGSILTQWRAIFLSMYPRASLYCIGRKEFEPSRRKKALERIALGGYDAVLCTYSAFGMIPARAKEGDEGRQRKAPPKRSLYFGYFFEDLGIDALFVDEAHNFKNLPTEGMQEVGGASSSERSLDLLRKVRHVQGETAGKGKVVFATGTPITNSIVDVYTMQRYLQPGELKLLRLERFPDWLGLFAEKKIRFEVDVTGAGFRLISRYSRFHNLPELSAIFSSIIDLYAIEKENLPDLHGYTDIVSPKSGEFSSFLKKLCRRADLIRGRRGGSKDNMLKVTMDGRKAALDLRLVDEKAPFDPEGKLAKCAEEASRIYFATMGRKLGQLVFCDTSVPSSGFNVYDELKRLLVEKGVPAEEIAYVHEATSDRSRDLLFSAVREGKVRILIGSTFKMGIGVNVQDRLYAIHHLDIPWRPADMVQREGRILREGNQNEEIKIFRYIAEGSFDAYSWQLLETKQSFISQLLSGGLMSRDGDDVDEAALDYAEVKALAIGNPMVRKRVEAQNRLSHLKLLQRAFVLEQQESKRSLASLPEKIAFEEKRLCDLREDLAARDAFLGSYLGEEKDRMRGILFSELIGKVGMVEARKLFEYRGFEIRSPSYIESGKPFAILRKSGFEHRAYLGKTKEKSLFLLDHYLDFTLVRLLKGKEEEIVNLRTRRKALQERLSHAGGYAKEIEDAEKALEEIEKEMLHG